MYADFSFYQNTYGGTVGEAEFSRFSSRAGAHLNQITGGRAKTAEGDNLEAVKMAECAIVDELCLQSHGGVITAESNDGISRSYATAAVKTQAQRIYSAAEIYLCNTNLLFVGV